MRRQGFTLIEFIIYIAIVAFILVLMTGFLWDTISGDIKETSYQEVQQNGRFTLAKIIQETKRATSINNPLPGISANSLSLAMANPSFNPTIFDLYQGKLRIIQGTDGPYDLTTNGVIVGNLKFTNLSFVDTPGTIRIEMEINHINPSGRVEYQSSMDFKSTVSLLPGGAAP